MTYVLYFFTVVVPGTAFLAAMWRYDHKHVPTVDFSKLEQF